MVLPLSGCFFSLENMKYWPHFLDVAIKLAGGITLVLLSAKTPFCTFDAIRDHQHWIERFDKKGTFFFVYCTNI